MTRLFKIISQHDVKQFVSFMEKPYPLYNVKNELEPSLIIQFCDTRDIEKKIITFSSL